MSAANMLQLHNVVDAASKFLIEQLHPSNCLGIRSFADMQNSQKLYKAANEYTMVTILYIFFKNFDKYKTF